MPARMLGPEGGGLGGSHIDWRRERVSARTLGPTSVQEENETFFIRVWKPFPSIYVLKTLRGSPKGKPKETIFVIGGFGLLQKLLEIKYVNDKSS